MTESEVLKSLNTLSEDEMTEQILIPLYRKKFKNKYYDIEFTGKDKRTDQGMDIQYYEITPDTETKEYYGIQVKQGHVDTGKTANGVASITLQAIQAFKKKIGNTQDKKTYTIVQYVVLTTGNIAPEARVQLVDEFANKNSASSMEKN